MLETNLKALNQSRAKIIIIAAVFQDARSVLQAASDLNMLGKDSGFTYVIAEAAAVEDMFNFNDTYKEKFKTQLVGTIGTRPYYGRGSLWNFFTADWLTRDPQNFTGAGSPITDGYAPYVIDAIYTMAHAADSLISQGLEPRGNALFNALKSVNFTGVTGQVYFDGNQDRPTSFEILNAVPRDAAPASNFFWRGIGSWTPRPGQSEGDIQFTNEETIVWPNGVGNASLPSDGIARTIFFIQWNSAFAITVIVILGVLVALQVLTSAAILIKRDTPIMAYSSVPFLISMQVGIVLIYVSVLAWFGDPTTGSCNVRIWFGFFGFALLYSALLAKVFRVYRIFSNKRKIKKVVITNAQLAKYVGILVLPQLIVLVLWTSIDTYSPFQAFNSAETLIQRGCTSRSIAWAIVCFAYCGIAGLAAIFLSFATRKLPSGFKETYWINNASFLVFLVGLICVVLSFLLADNLESSYAVAVIGLLTVPTAIWGFLYGPKLYIAFIVPDKNIKATTYKSTPGSYLSTTDPRVDELESKSSAK